MTDSLKQKTVKGVSWSFVEQILTRGVNFVIGIILARLLSPTDYGLVGMLTIFIAFSQIFVDGGLTNALIREKDASDKDYSTVYITNMTLSVIFYFLLFFSAPLVATYYEQPLLKPLMRVISLILIISSVASVQGTLLTKRVDFRTKFAISFISALVSGAAGVVCALKGLGPWALVAQSVASASAITILTLALVRWMPGLSFSKESFKRLFSYSYKLMAASLINTVYSNIYPMVIGKRFSASDVGMFTRGDQFPTVASETLVSTFNRVYYPVLSNLQEEDQKLIEGYDRFIQIYFFFTFPILMGLCGSSRPLVSLLLTDKWLACVPLMQLLCFSKLSIGLIRSNLTLLYVKGRSDLALRMEIIKKCIMFPIMFVSMFFGLKVFCYALIINSLIDLYCTVLSTKKVLNYSLWQQLKSIAPYFFISLVVLTESLLFSHFIDNNWVSLGLSVVICIVSYLFLTKRANLYAYNEAMGLLKSIIRK